MPAAHHPRVLIAGGGVGAVEAALALRALAGAVPSVELVSPDNEFVYRPLAVTEPFGASPTARLALSELHASHDVAHRRGSLQSVFPGHRTAILTSGEEVTYDALIVAIGARPEHWLDGAVTFRGPQDTEAFRTVLSRIQRGEIEHLAFASPPGAGWVLPLYELALLTAAWIADEGVIGVELSVVCNEARPLEAFGPSAASTVADLFSDRGILFVSDQATSWRDDMLTLTAGRPRRADAVVTMASLRGNPVSGLPHDPDGFIPTDDYAAVKGVSSVWAVGDATTWPIKQGGLAAQQADTAAAAVAADLGVPITVEPFDPVMRGILLTGVTSAYLRADARGDQAAFSPLWWPPTKIAGHYLGPYLADVHHLDPHAHELRDRRYYPADSGSDGRDEIQRLARTFAEADARCGDYGSALRWLRTLERLSGDEVGPQIEDPELRSRWAKETAATVGHVPA